MSLPVDRDLRRAEVARAAYEIVAAQGLEMLTVRAVAKARGCSTAVVSHYFHDKRDLLVAVYRVAADLTFARWEAVEADGGGLFACLVAVLPVDPDMRSYWRVYLSFRGVATLDPALGTIQNDVLQRSEDNVQRLLAQHPAGAALGTEAQRRISRQILSLQIGIATQASFGQAGWPAERQVADLENAIAQLLV